MNSHYDVDENLSRLRRGLKALMLGNSIEFAQAQASLMVVFNGRPSPFFGGRILLFQQFLLDHLGFVPEIVRQAAGCIKVVFDIGADPSTAVEVADLLKTDEFKELCRDLQIVQVAFRGEVKAVRSDDA